MSPVSRACLLGASTAAAAEAAAATEEEERGAEDGDPDPATRGAHARAGL